jgi:hypothetical protein
MNGVSAFVKEVEVQLPFYHVRTQLENTFCDPELRLSSDIQV